MILHFIDPVSMQNARVSETMFEFSQMKPVKPWHTTPAVFKALLRVWIGFYIWGLMLYNDMWKQMPHWRACELLSSKSWVYLELNLGGRKWGWVTIVWNKFISSPWVNDWKNLDIRRLTLIFLQVLIQWSEDEKDWERLGEERNPLWTIEM